MDLNYLYQLARFILLMLLVVALGMFIINSAMSYRYKVEFIKTPCNLCRELNPNMSECINDCFTRKVSAYPDQYGNLKDNLGRCYDLKGSVIKCKGEVENSFNYSQIVIIQT